MKLKNRAVYQLVCLLFLGGIECTFSNSRENSASNLPVSDFRSVSPASVRDDIDQNFRNLIARTARRYLGIRYRSSGKNPRVGFDCSGFTGFVFKKMGIPLKASSPAQAKEGKRVSFHSAQKGDLAFFGHRNRKGRFFVNHAAIVISDPGEPLSIIHAASRKGIVITRVMDEPYWRKSLLFVKSVL
jgi:cell wall-associated NlpC family hydrolase